MHSGKVLVFKIFQLFLDFLTSVWHSSKSNMLIVYKGKVNWKMCYAERKSLLQSHTLRIILKIGDSFAQFRFAEEKEWDAEASCPKQNSAFYVDCESLVRALQELPISLRLNVAAELVQTALPLELPQVKPKRNDEGKGLGMQLKGPLGPGGKGSVPELKPATAGCPMYLGNDSPRPGPSKVSQKPASPPQSAADHLEEELDLLLNLDAPVRERENMLPDQIFQDLEPKKEGEVAQEEKVPEKASVMEENNVESEQPSTSKHVTEEELEDWLDSMIS
uniref:Apoptosis and caspase activation inhibitor n=1 Tax=Equus caballus TaxID=9796 RepID=A0A3Q2HGT7_HORSE